MLKLVSEYPITVLNAYHLTFAEPQHAHVLIKIANDHVLIIFGAHNNTSGHESERGDIPDCIFFTCFTLVY